MNATEYCIDCVSVVSTMEAVQVLLLAITIVVVILVTVLVERSFISDEKVRLPFKGYRFSERNYNQLEHPAFRNSCSCSSNFSGSSFNTYDRTLHYTHLRNDGRNKNQV